MNMLKMAGLKLLVLALMFLSPALCEEECSPEEIMEENLMKLGQANNFLAVRLHRKLAEGTEDNLVFSPFTVSTVLAMLYTGAAGETARELRKFLGFHRAKLEESVLFSTYHHYLAEVLENIDSHSYTLQCASALLVDRSFPLSTEYKYIVQRLFQAYVEDVDIAQDSTAVTDTLNSWVNTKTGGTIRSLVEDIDPTTALILVSAAYFKGSWRVKFDPKKTKNLPFYNGGLTSNQSDVPMMHATASYRYYEEDGDLTAIEMTYEGKDMSMIIFLPLEIDGLFEMEQDMTPSKIAFVRRRMYYTKIHLRVPKFKFEFNKVMSTELKELGVTKVFNPGADLSGMTEGKSPLTLSTVMHKATIEVNEKGSVAASISGVIMTRMMPSNEPVPEVVVDHPFLFAIVDTKSGLILFMGRVNKL